MIRTFDSTYHDILLSDKPLLALCVIECTKSVTRFLHAISSIICTIQQGINATKIKCAITIIKCIIFYHGCTTTILSAIKIDIHAIEFIRCAIEL